jgi:4-hydroxybenzoate polyprenyltransferase
MLPGLLRTGFVLELIRWKDWGHSKMPPFFAAGFLFLVANEPPGAQDIVRFSAWILFCAAFLAFGYGVNDFSDRDTDRRAGKGNAMDRLGPAGAVAWLLVLLGIGLAALGPYLADRRLALMVASTYALALAYSLPPLRLKERGLAGLLACALAQRSLPLLVGAALFRRFDLNLWLFCALFALVGLRWILLHQVLDAQFDEQARVHTFVLTAGTKFSLFLMKMVVFPLELATLSAWLISASRDLPALWLLVPVYVGGLRFLGYARRRLWPPFHWTEYWLHPLADFYEAVLPLFLGILASIRNPVVTPLLLLLVIWQAPRESPRLAFFARLLKQRHRASSRLGAGTRSGG